MSALIASGGTPDVEVPVSKIMTAASPIAFATFGFITLGIKVLCQIA
ncbi:unannotated protein [freshwater metagenome]|uniref:Unannotated protein n=1 Tax=freshwater metagenome TaxID=449393 RepID=A0A6J7QJW8_9ZZZZ